MENGDLSERRNSFFVFLRNIRGCKPSAGLLNAIVFPLIPACYLCNLRFFRHIGQIMSPQRIHDCYQIYTKKKKKFKIIKIDEILSVQQDQVRN